MRALIVLLAVLASVVAVVWLVGLTGWPQDVQASVGFLLGCVIGCVGVLAWTEWDDAS